MAGLAQDSKEILKYFVFSLLLFYSVTLFFIKRAYEIISLSIACPLEIMPTLLSTIFLLPPILSLILLRRPGAGRIYFHLAVNITIILVYNLPSPVIIVDVKPLEDSIFCEWFRFNPIYYLYGKLATVLSTGLGLMAGAAAVRNYEGLVKYLYYATVVLWTIIVVVLV
jgi:hypothetical protein